MTEQALRECPFCGGQAIKIYNYNMREAKMLSNLNKEQKDFIDKYVATLEERIRHLEKKTNDTTTK